jgi:hypothetical protein
MVPGPAIGGSIHPPRSVGLISHHDKCVFVHVPKCAGQSVELFFLDRIGLDWERRAPLLLRPNDVPGLGPPRLAHLKAHEYVQKRWMTPAQFDEYFKFTFVRNPWDRVASFYRFLGYDRLSSFPGFVRKHLPRQMEKKSWFLCPQADYLYDEDNKLLVDFVGRFETLAQDFQAACTHMGIPDPRLPHVNQSLKSRPGLKGWLRRPPLPYRDMYDERSKVLVGKMYERDVEAFRYPF